MRCSPRTSIRSTGIPTFILTPLTYFGGVFYSITLLPPWAQQVSYVNPILHMVNAFRFGFLGVVGCQYRHRLHADGGRGGGAVRCRGRADEPGHGNQGVRTAIAW